MLKANHNIDTDYNFYSAIISISATVSYAILIFVTKDL